MGRARQVRKSTAAYMEMLLSRYVLRTETRADCQRVQNIRVSSEGRRIDGFISLLGAVSQVRIRQFPKSALTG